MYIRLGQGNIDASRIDEVLTDIRTGLAAASRRPGFRHAYVAVNRANARAVTISMWDAEEQASFTGSPAVTARRQTMGLQPEPVTVFEVTDAV